MWELWTLMLVGPAEKINITVPAITLRRIDAYVKATESTRAPPSW